MRNGNHRFYDYFASAGHGGVQSGEQPAVVVGDVRDLERLFRYIDIGTVAWTTYGTGFIGEGRLGIIKYTLNETLVIDGASVRVRRGRVVGIDVGLQIRQCLR